MSSSTVSTYDKFQDIYDQETIEFWENFPTSTLDAFKNLLPGSNVVDLGSGPGRDALLLKDRGIEVTCMDASEEMVKRTESLGFTSIHSTFDQMEFADKSFDGVWAFTSLLHVSKNEMVKTIEKIYKLLKPKGVFLIGMIEGDFEGEVERESMPGTSRYFKYYKSEELKELIEPIGFRFQLEERYTPHSNVYVSQLYVKK